MRKCMREKTLLVAASMIIVVLQDLVVYHLLDCESFLDIAEYGLLFEDNIRTFLDVFGY